MTPAAHKRLMRRRWLEKMVYRLLPVTRWRAVRIVKLLMK